MLFANLAPHSVHLQSLSGTFKHLNLEPTLSLAIKCAFFISKDDNANPPTETALLSQGHYIVKRITHSSLGKTVLHLTHKFIQQPLIKGLINISYCAQT